MSAVESRGRMTGMLTKIMPELPSDDVTAPIAHYRDVLGFGVNYEQGDLGVMDRRNGYPDALKLSAVGLEADS